MGYMLEIGAFTTRNGRPAFRSVTVGNPTRSHYGPVLELLGLEDAGEPDGNWTPVAAASVRAIDTERLTAVNGISEDLVGDLLELQGDLIMAGDSAQTFARLTV
ncbi:MAG: hypothetical protein DI537_10690 [Stutzerimonas stutzeri]|nr:MAG: hypothetical protein DI537_10690 [Stutzerimonas stutzeri]